MSKGHFQLCRVQMATLVCAHMDADTRVGSSEYACLCVCTFRVRIHTHACTCRYFLVSSTHVCAYTCIVLCRDAVLYCHTHLSIRVHEHTCLHEMVCHRSMRCKHEHSFPYGLSEKRLDPKTIDTLYVNCIIKMVYFMCILYK